MYSKFAVYCPYKKFVHIDEYFEYLLRGLGYLDEKIFVMF
jgi:hypothetical protein